MQRAVATTLMHGALYDSHCHLRLAPQGEEAAQPTTTAAASNTSIANVVLCGTHPQIDWDLIEAAVTNSAASRPVMGFGLHPWFVPALPPAQSSSSAAAAAAPTKAERGIAVGAECACCASTVPAGASPDAVCLTLTLAEIAADLTERLVRHPAAVVAEIGLDKLRGPPEAAQVDAFRLQLRIAAAHARPVSVHCVRHYGLLLQILQDLPAEETPPAITIHAFTGSLEIAKALLNLKNKRQRQPSCAAVTGDEACATASSENSSLPARKTRRAGASTDTVRIKERVFFGVGLTTSFTVKNFAAQTLPVLLQARRVLLETDAHYRGEAGWGGGGASGNGCEAQTCVYVQAQEHAEQLQAVMRAVETAALQSAELVQAAAVAGVTADEMARDAVAAAYANAFSAVLL